MESHLASDAFELHDRIHAFQELIDPSIPIFPLHLHRRHLLGNQHILVQAWQHLVVEKLLPSII